MLIAHEAPLQPSHATKTRPLTATWLSSDADIPIGDAFHGGHGHYESAATHPHMQQAALQSVCKTLKIRTSINFFINATVALLRGWTTWASFCCLCTSMTKPLVARSNDLTHHISPSHLGT